MKSSNRFRIFRSIPLILMTAAFPLFFHSCTSDEEIAVISPDRMNSIVFILHEGKACYLVQRAGTTVIDSSLLGFEFGNGESLAGEFRMKEARITGDHKRWETSWGQQKRVLDWHSKLSVILEETNGDGRILQIEFKASNDGVAFRYLSRNAPAILPENSPERGRIGPYANHSGIDRQFVCQDS